MNTPTTTWPGPNVIRPRRRIPGFLRRRRAPGAAVVNGVAETWSLAYVTDVILTRDPWMHRLDLARATGQDPVHTADHDGVIVADVVAEWARRHGQSYRLELAGAAGGSWTSGTGGEEIVMAAATSKASTSALPCNVPEQTRSPNLLHNVARPGNIAHCNIDDQMGMRQPRRC